MRVRIPSGVPTLRNDEQTATAISVLMVIYLLPDLVQRADRNLYGTTLSCETSYS